jgi:carbamoyltransferase
MTGPRFDALFGGPPRAPESPLEPRHMDIAASIQAVTEEVVLRLVRAAVSEYGIDRVCLAGGVALNCVANGRVLREAGVGAIWVQPAAGDAGGALGAALVAHYLQLGAPRHAQPSDAMRGAFLGPEYDDASIRAALDAAGARYEVLDDAALLATSAEAIERGQVLGWFQGPMEFGPRALGARSILGDPRSPEMQSRLNLKIKFRESFRPFAPAVLRHRVSDWFELDQDSPYMLVVAPVAGSRRIAPRPEHEALTGIELLKAPRSQLPAVTHIDYSARIQTVHPETHPRFHALIEEFERRTGCPVLVNTSFNVRGEPIVCTPADAFRCFMGTEMDALAIGNCFLRREAQDPGLRQSYHLDLAPD